MIPGKWTRPTSKGCVAKTRRRTQWPEGSPFLLRLDRHSKEAGDEGNLPADVSFAHPSDLSLPDHVHDLIPLQRSPRRFHGKEAHPRLDEPFDEAMVLLDQIIEVFDLSQFDTLRKQSSGFKLCNGFRIRCILININDARSRLRGVGISHNRGLFHQLLDRTRPRS